MKELTVIITEKLFMDGKSLFKNLKKRNTSPLYALDYLEYVKKNLLKREECLYIHLTDWKSGKNVVVHRGSINYNEYKKKFIMIFVEIFGSPGYLGELWYTESLSPIGPFDFATKIATNGNVNFYNPVHHKFFDKENGKIIYFEGELIF
jgi:hypothetical protein